jgi:hypothetical protein
VAQQGDVPKDSVALAQRVKDITEADNPDDASMAFEDMREAIRLQHLYGEDIVQSTKARLSGLDTSEKNFQTKISQVRTTLQPCNKDTVSQAVLQLSSLQYNGDMFFNGSAITQLRSMQTLPPEKACLSLSGPQGLNPLEKAFAEDIEHERKDQEVRLAGAYEIAKAYGKRYSDLKGLRERLTKENGLRGAMLWIVAGVCLFACITLSVIKLYTDEQAMEVIKSGQLIQFPTVMILLVVIVVLGLTSILQENTLGTLLGGVAGYVLSQGVGRAATRDAERIASPSQVRAQ